jgi:nitrogen-specific signal transduction histidine kinase
MRNSYPPLTVEVYEGTKQYVYYKDSRLLTELEQTLDDLINSFISETVMNSASVPVILTDSSMTEVIRFGNVDSSSISTTENLKERLSQMREANDPIPVELDNQQQAYIFYENSVILTQLRYYPYVQFLIVGLFLVIAYLIFSTFRNAEQNQVWIGMAKETAHQLGTPLSSLMAWIQLLQAKGVDDETIGELNKDVKRLETITDRFSKIGSQPELNVTDIKKVVDDALDYFRPRVSRKVEFEVVHNEQMQTRALINRPLFSWVLENLIKNSIDAMEGEGKISIEITNDIQHVLLDISDTGKGIPSGNQKAVFEPGYTTKKRGWGLGLSLTKRIIENYHEGKIFVKRSEPKKGTTFRIVLKTRARSNRRNGNSN